MKIEFESWAGRPEAEERPDGYRIIGVEWGKFANGAVHGKSRGFAICPCCSRATSIFVWSFTGGGKRCEGCGLLLYTGSAYLYKKEVPKGLDISKHLNIK